jgi:hypothetical protein
MIKKVKVTIKFFLRRERTWADRTSARRKPKSACGKWNSSSTTKADQSPNMGGHLMAVSNRLPLTLRKPENRVLTLLRNGDRLADGLSAVGGNR